MILSIGDGMDETDCQTWINTYGLTHTVLADPTRTMYPLFGDGFIPFNAIIDGNVILQYSDSGFDQAVVVATIEDLLLGIDHAPAPDSEDETNPYPINCSINSALSLIPDQLLLHWNLDGGATFTDVILTPVGGDAYTENFTAEIPAQPYDTDVYYYLSAENSGARTATDPPDAPTGLHSFYVGVDTTPPVIEHVPLGNQVVVSWPPTVSATVTDNQGVDSAILEFTINGGPVESVPMAPVSDGVYSADLYGSVAVGDMVEYRITAVDVASTPNTTVDPASGDHVFFVVEQTPVFIFEPDPTPLSGAAIAQVLDALGMEYDMGTTLPANCNLYSSIFVCLGIYSTNYQLTASEGLALADFLDNGGQLYMEGGDTWAYDPATAVHPYFNINGLTDGASDAGPIEGAPGTFAEGMYFTYQGANNYIDHLDPIGSAFPVFLNVTPAYINGVAYDGGTYRTVGTSFEFGGLVDGAEPSTKNELLVEILEFFDMNPLGILCEDGFESGDTSGWSATVP